jgi:IS30 family transposase
MESVVAELPLRFRLDVVQAAWDAFQAGLFASEAGDRIGVDRTTAKRMLVAAGGVRPRRGRNLKGRCLSFLEREEIALGIAAGESIRQIANRIGRAPSTVSRELARNSMRGRYRAATAQVVAYHRASRPKSAKLVINQRLRARVEEDLARRRSPEQIVGRLRRDFPDDPEMRVSTETIYQSLYVQSRGALKQELTRCLRTGRAVRRPSRKAGQRKNRIPNMVNISDRPAMASDRAVPGSWEGDLIIGARNASAIGTLVERSSNYTMLVPLPEGYKPEQVAPALTRKIRQLPERLRKALTWDQGAEMRDWEQVKIDTGIQIYFCDPHSPWQRGINENTNGLLRQYFPKGTPLGGFTEAELDAVAAELNDRPRKRLDFRTPNEVLGDTLLR